MSGESLTFTIDDVRTYVSPGILQHFEDAEIHAAIAEAVAAFGGGPSPDAHGDYVRAEYVADLLLSRKGLRRR